MKLKAMYKTPAGTAFAWTLAVGFLTHLFALINVIHNYDSIHYMPYGQGSGIYSGRFTLSVLGGLAEKLGGNTNLPLFNGLVFLVLIALSAYLLVSVLSIRSRGFAALVGMLLVVFPTAASTMIHRFTAIYYGLAVLLAVTAVWVLGKTKFGLPISALCTAVSLGIYQALVPVTISIMVLLLIQQALRGDSDFLAIVKRGLYFCAALVLGLLLYFLLLKLCLALYHTELTDYQGINEMGSISLAALPGLVWGALVQVVKMLRWDYCGLTATAFLKLAYLVLGAATLGMMGYILAKKIKKPLMILLTAVLALLFLIAVNFIYIQCPASKIYTLMAYSFALLACAPIVVYECLPEAGKGKRQLLSRGIGLALSVMIFSYAYLANTNYTAIYYADRQVENYLNAMIAQVRMTEGFDTEKQWAFIGPISDPLMKFSWENEMTYGGFTGPEDMLNCHSTFSWMNHYMGYYPPLADEAKLAELAALEEVRAMPTWPNAGSIKAIGDTMVIKCGSAE
ncbi:MAG: glucosyltransferase domain-containing protein [Eubacteriales bacterium]|nr:glucosyltransferase domain-containing protein [Eubacteriales bacterium]